MRDDVVWWRSAGLVLIAVAGVACAGSAGDSPVESSVVPVVMTALSPTTLAATVATAVDGAPTVRVTDAQGAPLPGIAVRFSIRSGEVAVDEAVSDARGVASAGRWVLGTRAGEQTLIAYHGAVRAMFVATARPAAPAVLRSSTAPDQVAFPGEVVRLRAVVVRDRFENAVGDVDVVFEVVAGNGAVDGAARSVRRSNAVGVVEGVAWTLGARPGANALAVRLADGEPVTHTARTVDRSTAVWYQLAAKREGTREWPAITADERTETRIALTPFDPCLCREQSGYVVERGSLWSAGWTTSLDGSASYRMAGSGAAPALTLAWLSGFGLPFGDEINRSGPARLTGDSLLIDRNDPDWGTVQLWIYTRSPAPPE